VELNNQCVFKGGIALGNIESSLEIKTFARARLDPPADVPLSFSLAWIYNGLPGYEAHSRTILPLIAFGGRVAGIAFGSSFRFTSFFGEPALFEPELSFLAYINFVNNKKLLFGISCANFDDFNAGNTGTYSLRLNNEVRFNKQWSLTNELRRAEAST